MVRTELDTEFGEFEFYCFSWGRHEEENILCQVRRPLTEPVLVRVQSACYTAEIFRSLDCDCHQQLEASLKLIGNGGGVFIYMLADGRGAGLVAKVRALHLWRTSRIDTADAYSAMGIPVDPREYDRVAEVLRYFGIGSIRLLTNNPVKADKLRAGGIDVQREPLEIVPTEWSKDYLKTKKNKMGHLLVDPNLNSQCRD